MKQLLPKELVLQLRGSPQATILPCWMPALNVALLRRSKHALSAS